MPNTTNLGVHAEVVHGRAEDAHVLPILNECVVGDLKRASLRKKSVSRKRSRGIE